jgi:hypothetical protein
LLLRDIELTQSRCVQVMVCMVFVCCMMDIVHYEEGSDVLSQDLWLRDVIDLHAK